MSEPESAIVIVGARWHPLRDAYHLMLRIPWWGILGVISGGFLLLNAMFAAGYSWVGGVHGVRSFQDAFFFSVQTMGTIGYGGMYPESAAANSLVVAEATVGLITTALATGIVFARFTLMRGQVIFTRHAVISKMNGVPTLSFRIGHDRSSAVFEAQIRVAVSLTEITDEGVTMYRLHDLKLARDRSPVLQRSWTVLHPILEDSPLHGMDAEGAKAADLELMITVTGTDDTSLQPVNARHYYDAHEIVWDARLADVLTELPDGQLQLNLARFHDIVRL